MAEPKRMTDDELKNVFVAEIQDSISYMGNESEIGKARADAMKRYMGEKYGDERVGRSQVVSRDVADTVEWILPSLLRIFAAGDDAARFEPTSLNDEEFAKQATDYINYVFMRDNPGFLILYTWFKDALIQKNGIVKYWWETESVTKVEGFSGLTPEQFEWLASQSDVTVLNHTENGDGTHDLKIKAVRKVGRIKIEAVPPEEFLISRRAKSIESAPFVGHRTWKTRAELIAAGYDEKIVTELPTYIQRDDTPEELERWKNEDDSPRLEPDPSMELIEVVDGYVVIDYDRDGIPEIVNAVLAGGVPGGKMLRHDLVELKPFASICPLISPHKFFGLSVADVVMDLQRIKTVLWRQLLDGTYLANNPMREVVTTKLEKGGLDDLLTAKIGGIIRVKESGVVNEVKTLDVAASALPVIQYTDQVRQERTGVSPMSTGADADALSNQSATAVNQMAAAASQRIELIARVFGETGLKDLFRGLLKLCVRHQSDPRMIRLRNQWVEMNPALWNPDMEVLAEVGLGHGNRDRSIGYLVQVLKLQMELKAGGVPWVTDENLYNTAEKLVAWGGLGAVEPYFTDPASMPPQPPKPDPKMMEAQGKLALQEQKNKGDLALKAQKQETDAQLKQQELVTEAALSERELQMEAMLAWWKAQMGVQAKQQEISVKTNLKSPVH